MDFERRSRRRAATKIHSRFISKGTDGESSSRGFPTDSMLMSAFVPRMEGSPRLAISAPRDSGRLTGRASLEGSRASSDIGLWLCESLAHRFCEESGRILMSYSESRGRGLQIIARLGSAKRSRERWSEPCRRPMLRLGLLGLPKPRLSLLRLSSFCRQRR